MTRPPGALDGPDVALPEGSATVDLPLGPLLVRLENLPVAWEPFVEEHYTPFAIEPVSSTAPGLTVACREGEGTVVELPPPGGTTRIDVARRGDGLFDIRSHWQDGWVDVVRGCGELVFTNRRYLPFRMSLENYLRVASQLMLIERRAFFIHGAGLLDREECYVLFGPSGSGKSTVTELSAPRRALSDDLVLIDVSVDRPVAHAVPFFGLFPPRERVRGSWPLAGLARLRQADAVAADDISLARAVATVAASVPFVHELGLKHDGLTENVARLCAAVPVVDLKFRRDDSFWPILRRACGRAAGGDS